jgi:hypothetical protein
MNAQIYTTADVAAKRGCHPVSVIRAAQSLGFAKAGRDWIFTAAQAEKLLGVIRDASGNPNFQPKPKKKSRKKTR